MTLVRLGDIAQIKYGKDHKKLDNGSIPVYGSGGLMRHVNDYLYDGESVLIPRKGSLNNLQFVNGKFWTVDTLFWTKINNSLVLPQYLYLLLSQVDFSLMNVGSAVPSLTTELLNEIKLDIPTLAQQRLVLQKITPINQKKEVNKQINDNLVA